MAKHSTKPTAEYVPTFHKGMDFNNPVYFIEAANRVVDKSNDILGPNPRRWERTQDSFLLAVKHFNTPHNSYFLDQLIMKCSEEIWNVIYSRVFVETMDNRKAEKAANDTVIAFEEFFE